MHEYIYKILLWFSIAVLVFGISRPPEQESVWLLCLWVASIPVEILALNQIPMPLRVNTTQNALQSLIIVIAIAFGMLSLQLLRGQVVWSKYLEQKTAINAATGETMSNIRLLNTSLTTVRGQMRDRNGAPIVTTVIGANGYTARSYPVDDPRAFAPIVGMLNHRYGMSGLEASYADYLTGERNVLGRFLRMFYPTPAQGDDIELTIDASLQQAVARIMGDYVGAAVVLDPATGAVLAMVSSPSFNLVDVTMDVNQERVSDQARIDANWQRLLDPANQQPLLNRATQGHYPPGSTFKLVTAGMVLESPWLGRPDEITCPETLDTEPGAPPVVNAVPNLVKWTGNPASLRTVIAFSCNTAFAQYALRLGQYRFIAGAEKFGFFTPEKVNYDRIMDDLPTIPSLIYVNQDFLNRLPGLADTGYGQGELQVTPLQMAVVTAAIGNNGVMMKPYVVERVVRGNGMELYRHSPQPIFRSLSTRNSAIIRDAMRLTVTEGFGKAAQSIEGVPVGGKSGTAEYGGSNTHAWFVALAPIDAPRFAVAVILEGAGEGSGIGAATAGQILRAAYQTVQP